MKLNHFTQKGKRGKRGEGEDDATDSTLHHSVAKYEIHKTELWSDLFFFFLNLSPQTLFLQ